MDTQDLNNLPAAGSNGASQPQVTYAQGRVLVFRRRPPNLEAAIDGLLPHCKPSGGIIERKVARLISRHAPKGWQFRVGNHVAGRSGDRIVHGIVLGTKSEPRRPAAFYRDTFTACWLLLGSGERAVANELRPVK